MSYPNVPLGKSEQDRRVAQALNHLLNQITFFQFGVEGQPDAGESLVLTQFPVAVPLVANQCFGWVPVAPTSDATFSIYIGGVLAGTIVFTAGSQEAVVTLTITTIPAFTDFEIVAPNPQDATLSGPTLTLAASL